MLVSRVVTQICRIAESAETQESVKLIMVDLPRANSFEEERRIYIEWLELSGDTAARMAQDFGALPDRPELDAYHRTLVEGGRGLAIELARAKSATEQAETSQEIESALAALVDSLKTFDAPARDAASDLPRQARADPTSPPYVVPDHATSPLR